MYLRWYAGISAVFITALSAQPQRITQIDRANRVTLAGHLHPRALAASDLGRVSPSLELSYVTLALAQTSAQKADLDQFLKDQQTPGSPNFHRWITPDQFADRFGLAQSDIEKIKSWLQSEGLSVAAVARGRNWIAVNGTAAQFESAFRTELHYYSLNGETHFANAAEPSIPAALSGVVHAIRGLHDFRMHPLSHAAKPEYTSAHGSHYIAPDDLAAIYDMAPLFTAGFDATGQSLVIAGQTQIKLSDIDQFRTKFNLPANDPKITLVPGSQDPGVSSGDLAEADLDLEWSGAVARNASILYVYASDVMTAVQYAIDQNLAPVVSTSYGSCELETPNSDLAAMQSWARQGNAQGITWFSASGDSGGADCDDTHNPGLAVDAPASIPEVTGIGGTEFSEGTSSFWNAMSDANGASVLSYIPEVAWNDSKIDNQPTATGGGASVFFAKPSWQTGPGVPSDNARHVPDVSLNASADHDGYMVYTGGTLAIYGGTSVPTPIFAGLTAVLNQYAVSKGLQSAPGLGNINPNLYALAQSTPAIFHDITAGDNIVSVSCGRRQINCNNQPVGYDAGPGYDQATGLGSIDAWQLVTNWSGASATPKSNTVLMLLSNLHSVGVNDTVYLTATVTSPTTPAGIVVFSAGSVQLGSATLTGSAGTATATLAVRGSQLSSGTITAEYNGASASVTVSSASSSSSATPAISALTNGASYQQAFAPGGVMTIWGSQLSNTTQQASAVPLPLSDSGVEVLVDGITAPIYYISSTLINVQIPYEVPPGPTSVSVNNNGQVAVHPVSVTATAPGIFIDPQGRIVPTPSAARGQETALYFTGGGVVSPAVSTGAAPASSISLSNLPKPQQNVSITVGGATATIDFLGIPPGLVGVTQLNFTVPKGIAPGAQQVVVKVGGVASAPATLIVN
jgi:uncharacterized protein (TIGR03437 family)